MRLLPTIAFTAASASAFSFSDITSSSYSAVTALKRDVPALIARISVPHRARSGGGGSCPAVWTQIASELKTKYVTSGQCNKFARAAIRCAFHDAGAWNTAQGQTGGADGSLILTSIGPKAGTGNANELTRDENGGLSEIAQYLYDTSVKYKAIDSSVTVADLIQFSAAVGIVSCPGGPQIKSYVGRKDSTTAAPNGLLPSVVGDAPSLYKLFTDKGFSAVDLAALLGAHTTSQAFNQAAHNIPSGSFQDSTPGTWDVKYYSETLQTPVNTDPNAPNTIIAVFPSDKNLATDGSTPVKQEFAGFVNNQGKWSGKFADAMTKMSLLGTGGANSLIDCTNSVPKGTSNKRDMRAAPINDRVR